MHSTALHAATLFALLGVGLACSPDSPTRGGLKIILEESAQTHSARALDLDQFLLAPSSASSFNCFAVNVTGTGVPSTVRFPGECTGVSVWCRSELVLAYPDS
jgi:hypothetical protein